MKFPISFTKSLPETTGENKLSFTEIEENIEEPPICGFSCGYILILPKISEIIVISTILSVVNSVLSGVSGSSIFIKYKSRLLYYNIK